jgi:hypothetical protein
MVPGVDQRDLACGGAAIVARAALAAHIERPWPVIPTKANRGWQWTPACAGVTTKGPPARR